MTNDPALEPPDEPGDLYELVYTELRSRARRMLAPGSNHTLQATALVHEAWLKLGPLAPGRYRDRQHFLAVAARAMRSVLVDHARAKGSTKRAGSGERVALDDALSVYEDRVPDVLALDDELQQLGELDQRLVSVVELRFFGGLTIDETAEVLGVSHATVERDWQAARSYLASRLGDEPPHGSERGLD